MKNLFSNSLSRNMSSRVFNTNNHFLILSNIKNNRGFHFLNIFNAKGKLYIFFSSSFILHLKRDLIKIKNLAMNTTNNFNTNKAFFSNLKPNMDSPTKADTESKITGIQKFLFASNFFFKRIYNEF
jgi:hypothetical protein